MNNLQTHEIEGRLKELVSLFVQGDFKRISHDYPSEYELTADEIREAVELYGSRLVFPPADGFRDFDIVEVKEAFPKLWDVRFFLWTAEEGKSDLAIVLDIKESSVGGYLIELRDILVP